MRCVRRYYASRPALSFFYLPNKSTAVRPTYSRKLIHKRNPCTHARIPFSSNKIKWAHLHRCKVVRHLYVICGHIRCCQRIHHLKKGILSLQLCHHSTHQGFPVQKRALRRVHSLHKYSLSIMLFGVKRTSRKRYIQYFY